MKDKRDKLIEKQDELIEKYENYVLFLKAKPNKDDLAIAVYDLQVATLRSQLASLKQGEGKGEVHWSNCHNHTCDQYKESGVSGHCKDCEWYISIESPPEKKPTDEKCTCILSDYEGEVPIVTDVCEYCINEINKSDF